MVFAVISFTSVSSYYFKVFQIHHGAFLYPWHVVDAQEMFTETGISEERRCVYGAPGLHIKHCDKHHVTKYKHEDLYPHVKEHTV